MTLIELPGAVSLVALQAIPTTALETKASARATFLFIEPPGEFHSPQKRTRGRSEGLYVNRRRRVRSRGADWSEPPLTGACSSSRRMEGGRGRVLRNRHHQALLPRRTSLLNLPELLGNARGEKKIVGDSSDLLGFAPCIFENPKLTFERASFGVLV